MTRLDELQKKYPDVPKDILAKWDLLVRGVKQTPDLDKVSRWLQPRPSYSNYDHDYTLQELKAMGKVKDGHLFGPPPMEFSSGLRCWTVRSRVDPYEVRDMDDGKFALFDGDEKVDVDVRWPPDNRTGRDPEVTSRGTPVKDIVDCPGYRFVIVANHFCEYFTTGEECKFCNFNPSQDDMRAAGIRRLINVNLDEAVEAYQIIGSKRRLLRGVFEAGGFLSTETEAKFYYGFVERIASTLPYTPKLALCSEALTRQHYQRFKDAGLHSLTCQMEVWAPELFDQIVPGKARHMPREQWVEALLDAVDVLGVGHVIGKFVSGVTLLVPDGFKDPEEAKASHIEGNNFCIENGIFPALTPPRWVIGAPYSKDPANRAKLPPTDYHLDILVAHHQAMMEHGLYPKLDVMYVPSLGGYTYSAEMGILAGAVPELHIADKEG